MLGPEREQWITHPYDMLTLPLMWITYHMRVTLPNNISYEGDIAFYVWTPVRERMEGREKESRQVFCILLSISTRLCPQHDDVHPFITMLVQLPRRAISECVWSECIHKRGCNLISRRRISLRFIPSQNNIRFLKTTKQYSVPKSSVLQHLVFLAEVGLVNRRERRGEEKE